MQFPRSEWIERAGSAAFEDDMARAIRVHGYVILEQALDPDLLASLKSAFDRFLDDYLVSGSGANRGANRFNTHLYLDGVFANEAFVANPLIMSIVYRILGIDVACTWAAADTPLPGSDYQVAHSDGRPLFRGNDLALPAYALAVNVPLVDFTMENGPLEIWENTHLYSDVPPDLGAEMREPRQVLMPAGSILLRDSRMWHRGSPNRGTESRPNLALVYNRSWYRFEGEAGHVPPRVSPQAYAGWSAATQRLFRFADVGESTAAASPTTSVRVEAAYELDRLEAEAGLIDAQRARMSAFDAVR